MERRQLSVSTLGAFGPLDMALFTTGQGRAFEDLFTGIVGWLRFRHGVLPSASLRLGSHYFFKFSKMF